MKYHIKVDKDLRMAVVTTHEGHDLDGFLSFSEELMALVTEQELIRVLVDHRDTGYLFSRVSREHVRDFAQHMRRVETALQYVALASVIESSLQFGIVRMWETMVDCLGVKLRHKVTYDTDEAMSWLSTWDGCVSSDDEPLSHELAQDA